MEKKMMKKARGMKSKGMRNGGKVMKSKGMRNGGKVMKSKGYAMGGKISPRKAMAMGLQNGGDVGSAIDPMNIKRAVDFTRSVMADPTAMAKPRMNVTGMNERAMDDAMRMKRAQMSSGGMRPRPLAVKKGSMT
tara:strand:+ start:149 stop:550 length:402 start_codon:yes stop_codon:yes gene_type:complete